MRWKVFLTISFIFLFSVSKIKAESWNGIYPLKSTRADVEKIMGECSSDTKWLCTYKLEDKTVFIHITETDCTERSLWKLPKDTVTDLRISFIKRPSISDLKIDLREFNKRADPDLIGQFNYFNREKGIEFVAENEIIKVFYYTPSEKDTAKYQSNEMLSRNCLGY